MGLSAMEEKVCRGIAARGSFLLEDLRLHVGLPTGGGNKAALDETRERLSGRLAALGAVAELVPGKAKPEWLYETSARGEIPPTVICRRVSGGVGGKGVLLAGHMDTVHTPPPKGKFLELSIAPDGKTATGPGCVDMKGGLVISVAALEAIEEAGVGSSWSFLLNSDEETGSYHSFDAIFAEAGSGRYGVGLAVEPATPEGGLVVERAGSGQFVIEAHGRAAHVGRDFTSGISAVQSLARAIIAAGELAKPAEGLISNVGPLQGGSAANVVADFARAWGNVRFRDEAGAAVLRAGLAAIGTEGEGLPRIVVEQSFNRPAKPKTAGTERLALLARGCAEDLGQELPFSATGGVCDGNIMQAAGLATIDTLGVRGGGLHTPQEWIELGSLVERCQMLALVVMRAGGV